MNTKISYLYRDAANYKKFSEVIISGKLEMDTLEPFFYENQFFSPRHVGLPDLREFPLNEDDHPWHEITACTPTDEKYSITMKVQELWTRFRKMRDSDWKEVL